MAYPNPINIPPAQAAQDSHLVQELSLPIYQSRGWLKFLGVMTILGGVLQASTIVGIIVAWLPIWMGVVMFQAGSAIEPASLIGDKFAFLRSMGNLKTYFMLQGVLTLLAFIFLFTMLCIMFILPLLGLTLIPWQQIMNDIPTVY
jgi:hypothetical protein